MCANGAGIALRFSREQGSYAEAILISDQNVELHRRIIKAYSARDIEAGIALSDPQIEVRTVFTAVGGGVYQGHDGLRTFQREFEDVWGDEFLIEPEAFFDLGEQTLAFTVARAEGRAARR